MTSQLDHAQRSGWHVSGWLALLFAFEGPERLGMLARTAVCFLLFIDSASAQEAPKLPQNDTRVRIEIESTGVRWNGLRMSDAAFEEKLSSLAQRHIRPDFQIEVRSNANKQHIFKVVRSFGQAFRRTAN